MKLPSTVTGIGDYAFYNSGQVQTLYCCAVQPPKCGIFTFYGVDKSTCTLYVPEASVEAYKSDNVFMEFSIIEGIVPSGLVNTQFGDYIPVATYTLDGMLAPANYSGLAIELMPDGSTRKVLLK